MAGQPNKGAWHGKKPEKSIPFKKGDREYADSPIAFTGNPLPYQVLHERWN